MSDIKLMTIFFYALAALCQLLAFLIAVSQTKKVGTYKLGWALLSIGLLLMLTRRIGPILNALNENSYHLDDALMALIISILLMSGLFWIRKLFDLMKNQEQMLEGLAKYDNLTGVMSRSAILDQGMTVLERSMRLKKPFAVLVLDLDKFKHINDTYGHSAGDQTLKVFAAIARKSLRNIDFFGRLGGDEFLAILPEVEMDIAVKIAERINENVCDSQILYEQHSLRLTTSIGIAYYHPSTSLHLQAQSLSVLLDSLIKTADLNMYAAKKQSGNIVNSSAYTSLNGASLIN